MQSGMPAESEEEIGTVAEASKAPIDPGAEITDTGGQRMAQGRRDGAMASLLGIQIGGIGRKPVHLDVGMGLPIRVDHLRAMGVAPVPEDDKGAGNVSLAVTEGDHTVLAADGPRAVSRVEATRHGSPDHGGEVTTLADAPQDRGLPLTSPGCHGSTFRRAGRPGRGRVCKLAMWP
jgi:hypothetical protein